MCRCLALPSDPTSNHLFPFTFSIFAQTAGKCFSENVGWSLEKTECLNTPVAEAGMLPVGKAKFSHTFRGGFWPTSTDILCTGRGRDQFFRTFSTLFTMTGNFRPITSRELRMERMAFQSNMILKLSQGAPSVWPYCKRKAAWCYSVPLRSNLEYRQNYPAPPFAHGS